MRIQYVLHADFELPGRIEQWAARRGHAQARCKPFRGERLPDVSEFDLLVVMGGPQSARELGAAPYLAREIELIAGALRQDLPVLGICLGAQLLGEACGARTERSPEREIGFFPIDLTEAGRTDPVLRGLPPRFVVAHWHGDMPGLAPGCAVLATSAGCPRQIVRYAPKAYGFQCHPEFTAECVGLMLQHGAADLAPGPYVQSAERMRAEDLSDMHARADAMLGHFLSNAADVSARPDCVSPA